MHTSSLFTFVIENRCSEHRRRPTGKHGQRRCFAQICIYCICDESVFSLSVSQLMCLKMLFILLLMLFRSICLQVSNQADKLGLLAIILLSADVSPT